jgi:N-acetylneuraminate synthase
VCKCSEGDLMNKTLIIAEAGVNHNGSLDMAIEMINVAAECGADIVKFQTFKAEKVISRYAKKAEYQTKTTDAEESQLDMVKKLELNEKQHRLLVQHCYSKGIEFMSTPFDMESIDLLVNSLNVARLKIPSGEITNAPLLLKAAQTGKPIILSTGMSTLGEVEMALGVLAFGYTTYNKNPSIEGFKTAYCSKEGQRCLKENVILMHCTTEYPAPINEINLRVIDTLQYAFGLPVGYSDHTNGIAVPIAAVARGAVVIEKHFTLDRNFPGPDHKASLEPKELSEMVKSIRDVEQVLGSTTKCPTVSEIKNLEIARKSLVARRGIEQGEVFAEENLDIKRPGTGVSPFKYWDYLGRVANRAYYPDEEID